MQFVLQFIFMSGLVAMSDGRIVGQGSQKNRIALDQAVNRDSAGNGSNKSNLTEKTWMTPVANRVLKESGQYVGNENQKDGRNDGKYPKDDLEDRMHMNEKHALPAQGYRGELVEHNDMKTATHDWQSEHTSFESYCSQHVDWCKANGYAKFTPGYSEHRKRKEERSDASARSLSVVLVLVG